MNAPYNGTPSDITVIKPVFDDENWTLFSMWHLVAIMQTLAAVYLVLLLLIKQQLMKGVLLDNVLLVADGRFLYDKIHEHFEAEWPARNAEQTLQTFGHKSLRVKKALNFGELLIIWVRRCSRIYETCKRQC